MASLCSDNARELGEAADLLGVTCAVAMPFASENNGIAARHNCCIVDGTRVLLEQPGLGTECWPLVARAVCVGFNAAIIECDLAWGVDTFAVTARAIRPLLAY